MKGQSMFFVKVNFYKMLMAGLKLTVKFIPQPQPLIFSGKNSSLELAQLMINHDFKRVLIVTDKILNQLGIADDISQLFKTHNVDVVFYDQVTPDPSEVVVENGVKAAKDHHCDVVLGLGGGSSLDAAKMIAVLAKSTKSVKNVAGLLKIKQNGLPLFLLPTTSGTGSEVTMAAVITDSIKNTKSLIISPKIMPLATALDAVLMKGMPAKITADTGFDALTHAIEAYLSTHASEQTNRYALIAIKLIFKQLPVAYKQGDNLDARQSLSLASCYAGLAFTKAGLGYVHAISHQIGAKYHLPHGMTNAAVLPLVLTFTVSASQQRLANLAKEIGLETDNLTTNEMAELFISAVKTLQKEVAIESTLPTIVTEDVRSLAKAALKEAHYLYPVPKYLNLSACEKLIKQLIPTT